MRLYSYWRSSASYRVRIALNLKQIAFETLPINLLKDGGQQHQALFRDINSSGLVPVLVDGGTVISQSLTILEYLDEQYPEPQLIPLHGQERYLVQSLAQDIVVDIHPLNNLRVQQYLTNQGFSDKQNLQWLQHWMRVGFTALDEKLHKVAGNYCVGGDVSLVDVCLVPQVYNALRFNLDITEFPTIERLYLRLMTKEAFQHAAPEKQPDAPKQK